jgi:gamma-glutamylcyclotransferase
MSGTANGVENGAGHCELVDFGDRVSMTSYPYIYYFAYGSNLHYERLKRRTPSAKFVEVASLASYELYFHKRGRDGSAKCNIIARQDSTVLGAIYRLSCRDQASLDIAEGQSYRRAWVKVIGVHSGITSMVLTYMAKRQSLFDGIRPYDWYKAFVIAGAENHAISAVYIDRLRDVIDRPDFHHKRSRDSRLIAAGMPWVRRKSTCSVCGAGFEKTWPNLRIVTGITTYHERKGYK